jgi:hypothetical protein
MDICGSLPKSASAVMNASILVLCGSGSSGSSRARARPGSPERDEHLSGDCQWLMDAEELERRLELEAHG